jgi:hypothetical protein
MRKIVQKPSIVMDLGLSDNYAQVISIPVKNISHRELKDDNCSGNNTYRVLLHKALLTPKNSLQRIYTKKKRKQNHG